MVMAKKNKLKNIRAVEEEFAKLTMEDKLRLDLAAAKIANDSCVSPSFLYKESLARVRDGRRKWPPKTDVTFFRFLCGVMKSVRSELVKKHLEAEQVFYDQQPKVSPGVEEYFHQVEDEVQATKVVEGLYEHFHNDELASFIIMGKVEGLDCSAIRKDTGMTQHEYDAAMKRIARYRKAFRLKGRTNEQR